MKARSAIGHSPNSWRALSVATLVSKRRANAPKQNGIEIDRRIRKDRVHPSAYQGQQIVIDGEMIANACTQLSGIIAPTASRRVLMIEQRSPG